MPWHTMFTSTTQGIFTKRHYLVGEVDSVQIAIQQPPGGIWYLKLVTKTAYRDVIQAGVMVVLHFKKSPKTACRLTRDSRRSSMTK